MTAHELKLDDEMPDISQPMTIYALPRSGNPGDFALISPLNEKQLLRHGIEGKLEIQAYTPVIDTVTSEVKRFLKQKLVVGREQNIRFRQMLRWASAVGIIGCMFFVFSAFIDDLLLDPFFVGVILYTFVRDMQEKRIIRELEMRIERLSVSENPLLTEVYEQIRHLDDSKEPEIVDWEGRARGMPSEELSKTLDVIEEFTQYRQRRSLTLRQSATSSGSRGGFLDRLLSKVGGFYFSRRLNTIECSLREQKRLSGGYLEMYDYLVDELSARHDATTRRVHRVGEQRSPLRRKLDK